MVVEVLSASVASLAVVAVPLHLAVAQQAELELICREPPSQLLAHQQRVDRVSHSQVDVVVSDEQQHGVEEAQQDPQYAAGDGWECRHDKDGVDGELEEEDDEGEELLAREGLCVCVDLLVGSFPLPARLALLGGALAQRHTDYHLL
jgi:hypothetical protein